MTATLLSEARLPKIHWFSPLPPDLTDIGHFTNRILPSFAGRAQVTVWTKTAHPVAADLPGLSIRPIQLTAEAIAELNTGDAIFYNLGNHGHFHGDILEAAWRVPGVVILHEADLHGLFADYWVERHDDGPAYIKAMAQLHGAAGEKVARARLQGVPIDDQLSDFPILAPALVNALGVICHTRMVEDAVKRLDLPVMRIPLAYRPAPLARERHRSGPIRLLQFGYLGPHRRLEAVLRALAADPGRDAFRFDIFGQIWDVPYVEQLIAELGLKDIVSLKGFVADSDLDRAIVAADMIFNLRYPTIGEASGTQLRIWNGAAPSLVSDIGWFTELPDDAAVKIDPTGESTALAKVLADLQADRSCYDALGLAGRAHLERHHDPDAYAEALLAAAAERRDLARRAAIYATTRRLGEAAGATLGPAAAGLLPSLQQRLAERLAADVASDRRDDRRQ